MGRCGICNMPIDEDMVEFALQASALSWKRHEVAAYHLDCVVSDRSWIRADDVTYEDREHGIYLIERWQNG
jgi:hypothetical protein